MSEKRYTQVDIVYIYTHTHTHKEKEKEKESSFVEGFLHSHPVVLPYRKTYKRDTLFLQNAQQLSLSFSFIQNSQQKKYLFSSFVLERDYERIRPL